MIEPPASAVEDTQEEIAALVRTLHETQQRLQELAGGQVDAVIHPGGHSYMLHEAQEKLRRSETTQHDLAAMQASILNALPAHIALLDHDGVIMSVNDGWRRFAGSNALGNSASGVGLNYLQVCERAQGPRSEEAHQAAAGMRAVLSGAVPQFSFEYPCHSPTEQRWFQLRVNPMENAGPRGAVAMHVDITERKLAEEAMRASEASMATAQSIAHFGSWELDLTDPDDVDANPLRWSDEMFRIAGYAPGSVEVSNAFFFRHVPAEEHEAIRQAIGGAIRDLRPYSVIHRLRRPDGEERIVREQGKIAFDKTTGQPLKVLGTAHDITERRQAERLVRESEERLAFAMEAAAIGDWNTDLRTNVARRSLRHDQCFGYAELLPEWGYDTFLAHVAPADRDRVDAAYRKAMAGEGEYDQEFRAPWPDGSVHWLWTRGRFYFDETGRPYRVAGIVVDVSERKQAEEKLAASEAVLRQFIEHAPAAIAMLDTGMRYLQASARWIQDYHLAGRDIIGQSHYEIFPDLPQHWKDIHQRVLAGAVDRCEEAAFPRADGSIEWLQWEVRPWHTTSGEIGGVLMFTQIVTARRRAADALRESRERLALATESARLGIWEWEVATNKLVWDEAMYVLYGVRKEDFNAAYDAWQSGVHPDDRQRAAAELFAAVEGTAGFHTEFRVVWPGGEVRDIEAHAVMRRADDGSSPRMIGVNRDITERKQAEREVRLNEQRYRSLVEATTAIVWDTPASGEFEVAQPGWSAFTGQTFAELRGWGWLNAIHPDDQEETARVWTAAVASRSTYQVEHRLQAHDGTYRDMVVRAVPILADDGAIVQWVGVHTDITDRKKLEQQFLRAQRMESIGTLAAGIAHDLNNSLAPIIMSLDLLATKLTDPESQELLEIISTSARRGSDMVRQVLSFGRGVEGERQEVQIRHLIRDIEKIVNDTFLKHIEVRTSIPNDLWTVVGDATQLHQVLLNLCVNARDAMPAGGTLSISAENLTLDAHYAGLNPEAHPGTYLFLQVEDSGTGMPPEVIEKIFDPFFTTKEVGKGTGLGLSTSLAIVKSHGGFVRVYSELEKGTTFKIYLPAQTETSSDVATDRVVELPRGHGELILVVDDESSVRVVTQQTLEAFGYRVVLASDGADAVALYATRGAEIAVVVTDMMMPVMDGPATIQVLRKLNPRLPIIAASGLTANDYVAKLAGLGVQHFLPKPYTAETLLKTLKKVLEGVG